MAELRDVPFFKQPIGGRRDPFTRSELGGSAYRDAGGNLFDVVPQKAQQRPTGGVARAAVGAAKDNGVKDTIRAMLGGLAEGAWQGISAPGRAAKGEPVTYGDAWATTGDWGLMSGLGKAPAGALRAGMAPDAKPSQAQKISDMLASGRAADVTDDMMAQADPSELWRLYDGGATGQAMPMDEASRMARAKGMGFTENGFHGTNTGADFDKFGRSEFSRRQESYFAPENRPDFASSFAASDQGRVLPVKLRSGKFIDGRTTAGNDELMSIIDDANLDFDWRYHRSDGETKRLPDWGEQNVIDAANRSGAEGLRIQERPTMTSAAVYDPTAIRSKFARFDPRLKHLANLSAGVGGVAMLSPQEQQKAEIRAYLEGIK